MKKSLFALLLAFLMVVGCCTASLAEKSAARTRERTGKDFMKAPPNAHAGVIIYQNNKIVNRIL